MAKRQARRCSGRPAGTHEHGHRAVCAPPLLEPSSLPAPGSPQGRQATRAGDIRKRRAEWLRALADGCNLL